MSITQPNQYFLLAMQLAEQARGETSPNPNVGAVLVKDGQVVGQGFTQPAGQDHAEVQALKAAGTAARGADMYVTLEPCSHWGRTPPCVDAIIKAGVTRVFAGITDPNPVVAGQGFERLRQAGVKVFVGMQEQQVKRQLEHYLCYIRNKRPFVSVKVAASLDGYIAVANGHSRWVTGPDARQAVHGLRAKYDSLLTGIGTVLADDPLFTVRLNKPSRQPAVFVLDTYLRIKPGCNLVKTASQRPVTVFCGPNATVDAEQKLTGLGLKVVRLNTTGQLPWQQVLLYMAKSGVTCTFVEAGPTIVSSLIKNNLVDKFYWFTAPKIVGGGLSAVNGLNFTSMQNTLQLNITDTKQVGSDLFFTAYPKEDKGE